MNVETFHGPRMSRVIPAVRAKLGDGAVILRVSEHGGATRPGVRVVATSEAEIERFRARLERPPAARARTRARGEAGPRVVALVGPTGSGKTTTAAKLALHADGFGGRRVGFLTLDTYRVGALEQIATYAEIMGVPLEVAYGPAEAADALGRLGDRDVVLVDTPGRSPGAFEAQAEWRAILTALDPDEVHLVVPAGIRADVARAIRDAYAPYRVSHLLLTKLDEVPGETGVAELADELDLPARWVCAGQEVPADLERASERLLACLCGRRDPYARMAAV